jgi:hypothetical protein
LLFGFLPQPFRIDHDELRHQLEHANLAARDFVSIIRPHPSVASAAYLGEDVEIREPGGDFRRPERVLVRGFSEELPSCVFVE